MTEKERKKKNKKQKKKTTNLLASSSSESPMSKTFLDFLQISLTPHPGITSLQHAFVSS